MTLDSPILPGFSAAKHAMQHQVPSSTFSVFPSYFAKFTEFFSAYLRAALIRCAPAEVHSAGKNTPDSRNISVA
jgi:hypothetical protein